MLQRDSSTVPVDLITSSHCYNDFTGCPFMNAWSSNCASWRIVVSTVLVRTTSRVTYERIWPAFKTKTTLSVYCSSDGSSYTTFHTWRSGFSCYCCQVVERTAERHHICYITFNFSTSTKNIFILSIIWRVTVLNHLCFCLSVLFFCFLFFSVSMCFYRVVACFWSAVCTYNTQIIS